MPRSRATLLAAVLTAVLALAEFGVLVPGAAVGLNCSMEVSPGAESGTHVPPAA